MGENDEIRGLRAKDHATSVYRCIQIQGGSVTRDSRSSRDVASGSSFCGAITRSAANGY